MPEENQNQKPIQTPEQADPKYKETLLLYNEQNGAVEAVIKAIERITKRKGTLKGYSVNAASEGKDALGEVTVHVDFGQPKPIVGKGASTDVIEASARAYLNAVNRSIRMENMPRPNNLDSGTI